MFVYILTAFPAKRSVSSGSTFCLQIAVLLAPNYSTFDSLMSVLLFWLRWHTVHEMKYFQQSLMQGPLEPKVVLFGAKSTSTRATSFFTGIASGIKMKRMKPRGSCRIRRVNFYKFLIFAGMSLY